MGSTCCHLHLLKYFSCIIQVPRASHIAASSCGDHCLTHSAGLYTSKDRGVTRNVSQKKLVLQWTQSELIGQILKMGLDSIIVYMWVSWQQE